MTSCYVTDGLIHNGRSYERGEKVDLPDEIRERLLETGQVSASKPKNPIPAEPSATPAEVTIADFSDEDILAAAVERGLIDQGKIDYSELNTDELRELAEKRNLQVERGDGKEGDPLKADYVAALEAADTVETG
jgi:hypothetical protein